MCEHHRAFDENGAQPPTELAVKLWQVPSDHLPPGPDVPYHPVSGVAMPGPHLTDESSCWSSATFTATLWHAELSGAKVSCGESQQIQGLHTTCQSS